MKKLITALTAIAVMLTGTAAVSAASYFEDSAVVTKLAFSQMSEGSSSGYENNYASCPATADKIVADTTLGKNVLKFFSKGDGGALPGACNGVLVLGNAFEKGKNIMEFEVMSKDTKGERKLGLRVTSKELPGLITMKEGNFVGPTGTVWMPYETGRWYPVKIVFDYANSRVETYIDNTLVSTDAVSAANYTASTTSMRLLMSGDTTKDAETTMFLSDLSISQPLYEIGQISAKQNGAELASLPNGMVQFSAMAANFDQINAMKAVMVVTLKQDNRVVWIGFAEKNLKPSEQEEIGVMVNVPEGSGYTAEVILVDGLDTFRPLCQNKILEN